MVNDSYIIFLQVGHLVLANSDYVIDSICRQLRHLDLNPHVPSVLAAMLSYIGVAHKILPLLEEPVWFYHYFAPCFGQFNLKLACLRTFLVLLLTTFFVKFPFI